MKRLIVSFVLATLFFSILYARELAEFDRKSPS